MNYICTIKISLVLVFFYKKNIIMVVRPLSLFSLSSLSFYFLSLLTSFFSLLFFFSAKLGCGTHIFYVFLFSDKFSMQTPYLFFAHMNFLCRVAPSFYANCNTNLLAPEDSLCKHQCGTFYVECPLFSLGTTLSETTKVITPPA